MLITQDEVVHMLNTFKINTKGVLHIGAHDCEELDFYLNGMGVNSNNIIWIDALQNKVEEAKARNIPNVFQAVITDRDEDDVTFNITNNAQSSSIFDFGTHSSHHPHIHFIGNLQLKTSKIDTFLTTNNFNPAVYNFWNLDIQGAELLALYGGTESLKSVDAIYIEVNTEEVYKNCALMTDIDKFLSQYGFKRVITKILEFGWGDALYLKV